MMEGLSPNRRLTTTFRKGHDSHTWEILLQGQLLSSSRLTLPLLLYWIFFLPKDNEFKRIFITLTSAL